MDVTIITIVWCVFLIWIYLIIRANIIRRKKHQQENETAAEQTDVEAVREIEEILRQKSEAKEQENNHRGVFKEKPDNYVLSKQKVKSDGNVHHDNDGHTVIHRDGEKLRHDTGKVYKDQKPKSKQVSRSFYDSRSDYSYDEEEMNRETVAFSNQLRNKPNQEYLATKKHLRNRCLVNGFIMAQILGKPRALKEYDEDQF